MTRFSGWRLQRVTLSSIYEYIIDVKPLHTTGTKARYIFDTACFLSSMRSDLTSSRVGPSWQVQPEIRTREGVGGVLQRPINPPHSSPFLVQRERLCLPLFSL